MKSSMNQNNMKLPTLVETMRDLYGFMGIKIEHQTDGLAKKLDDYAFEKHVPHYFEEEIIEHFVPQGFSTKTKQQWVVLIKRFIVEPYCEGVRNTRLFSLMDEGFVRDAYWKNFIVMHVTAAINQLLEVNHIEFFGDTNNGNCLQSTIQNLRTRSEDFQLRWNLLDEMDKNYVHRWGDRDALPEPNHIKKLFLNFDKIHQAQDSVQNFEILCLARLLQALQLHYGDLDTQNFNQKLAIHVREKLVGKKFSKTEIEGCQAVFLTVANAMMHYPFLNELEDIFLHKKIDSIVFCKNVKRIEKTDESIGIPIRHGQSMRDGTEGLIRYVEEYCGEINVMQDYLPYVLWQKANFLVYKNDYTQALSLYSHVLDSLMYYDMRYLEKLIGEALVVACLDGKADKFITKLANLSIRFNMKLPVANELLADKPKRIGKNHVFKSWEKEAVLPQFGQYFSLERFIDKGKKVTASLPPFHGIDVDAEIKPDFKNPDKLIFIDLEKRRKSPQLLYFVMKGNYSVVEKLLQLGANVNAKSSNNETALLLSIQSKNEQFQPPFLVRENDEKIFRLLLTQKISKENLNSKTHKRNKTAISQAILSAQPERVQALLELGADPNLVGMSGQTPLYQCLYMLDSIRKQRTIAEAELLNQQDSMYERDYRYRTGIVENHRNQNAEYVKLEKMMRSLAHQKLEIPFGTEEDIFAMICALLKAGANPNNMDTEYPLKGYTPFMFAVELNLVRVVEVMLEAGADLSQYYIDYRNGEVMNLKTIARNFGSSEVLFFIEQSELVVS